MRLFHEVTLSWNHLRANGIRASLFGRETPFLIQFGKYGICGVLSVLVFAVVVILGHSISPQKFSMDLPPAIRSRNLSALQLLAFLPSNFAAYYLNRLFVFTPGRHRPGRELALFTAISFFSFALGLIVPVWLVAAHDIPNTLAHGSFILSSALINFVARKFLVFER